MRTECPKCHSLCARFEVQGRDIWLRCLCGFAKIVYSKTEPGMAISKPVITSAAELKLPQRDTKLWDTLMVLYVLDCANSAEITERLIDLGRATLTVSDVSSYLTMLRTKGLVRTLENRRGAPGGSTWELTEQSMRLVEA